MAHIQAFSATILPILYLRMLSLIQLTSPNSIGFSLRLIPRDSPESPLYFRNTSQSEKMRRILLLSKARAFNLNPDNLRLHLSLVMIIFIQQNYTLELQALLYIYWWILALALLELNANLV